MLKKFFIGGLVLFVSAGCKTPGTAVFEGEISKRLPLRKVSPLSRSV
ncbi:hypothetical protein [Novosphingobium sp.]|nr:hypothetical protein [Novosphingobium sp.]MBX9663619.1 hypothetical protein [Novosphingobium sp.]